MNRAQWKIFCDFRDDFKSQCKKWNAEFGEKLISLQREAAKADTPFYPLETQVVYNTALDELTENSDIKLIVIGDNPGKDEQLARNQKYLVGQSGKIATSFFAKNSDLGVDFRKNVIILNKTPIHTAKTKHLRTVEKSGGKEISDFILKTQSYMAQKTAELHKALCKAALSPEKNGMGSQLWLIGYSELKARGIFESYRNILKDSYADSPEIWEKVFVFQHFSMNRFSIDLKNFIAENHKKNPEITLMDAISGLGKLHRNEIFI